MSTFRVQWDEKAPSSKNPSRKATTISANSVTEAKAKVRQRINISLKVTNMTAVKVGK